MHRAALALARFYPIVPDIAWLRRIVPLGVGTIQLRLKDRTPAEIETAACQARDICQAHGCQLILNDYWEVAIAAGIDAVHLGQEDLERADLAAIRAAGIAVGISTHDERELDVALRAAPDYVALGPVYETRLKKMPFGPQELDRVAEWKRKLGVIPLVAIGGLTPERAQGVLAAGADSLAVITDVVTNPDPEARVRVWLATTAGT